jgi:hypothetical protein
MPNPPREPHDTPPSVADVARLAGVSPATVSRAFNTPALLVPETLERVQRPPSSWATSPTAWRARCASGARWWWAS